MTRLLVSVRSVDEALLAADASVDLIDVKEPAHGPLGMADASVRRKIGQRLGDKHQLSAACGELRDFVARSVSDSDKVAHTALDSFDPSAWTGFQFAKIGLAGCAEDLNWREWWLAWRLSLPTSIEPVLVCYADYDRCGAPTYEELRAFASQIGVGMLLFDTWDKCGPGLCELWQTADFLRVGQELREAQISFVLAGKLGLDRVSALRHWGASYLGIRGAVCDSTLPNEETRCGKLNAAKIAAWRQALNATTFQAIHQPTSIDV